MSRNSLVILALTIALFIFGLLGLFEGLGSYTVIAMVFAGVVILAIVLYFLEHKNQGPKAPIPTRSSRDITLLD